MAASRFRPPLRNRKSRKGLQNKPTNVQVSIRKALDVLETEAPSNVNRTYTVSGCYCSRKTAVRHAKFVLGLPDQDRETIEQ